MQKSGLRHVFPALFLPLAALVIAVAAIGAQGRVEAELTQLASEETGRVKVVKAQLASEIEVPTRHLASLRREDPVRAAIENPTPETLRLMASAFQSLLQRNPGYSHARWIDETGRERARVNQPPDGSTPEIVPEAELQDKSDRPFILAAIDGRPGEILASPFDLSVEHREIEIPYKPVIRLATAVADRTGARRGVLVITILGRTVLDHLSSLVSESGNTIMLLNKEGYWLQGPDPGLRWGFMFGRKDTLAQSNRAAWERILAEPMGYIEQADGLWVWNRLTAVELFPGQEPQTEPYWLIVSHKSADQMAALRRSIWQPTYELVALTLVITGGLSWLLSVWARQRQDALLARAKAEAAADDSARRFAELEAAHETRALLTAIVTDSGDAIISTSPDGVITSWNPAAAALFGHKAREAIGQPADMLIPEDCEEEPQAIIAEVMTGRTFTHLETRRMARDGHVIDVSLSASPLRDSHGRVVGTSQIVRDISAQKHAAVELEGYREHLEDLVRLRTEQIVKTNELLRESEKFITTVTDNLPGMVGYWDRGLHCRFANLGYLEWLGKSREQMVGTSLEETLDPELYQKNLPFIQAVLAGEPQQFERMIPKASGEMGHALAHYIPDLRNGEVIGFFVLITDVTPIKQAEMQVREINDRLATALEEACAASQAKGRFLANMSHEIRTPMNAVLGFLELAQGHDLSPVVRRQLRTAQNAARSLLLLINDVLDLSKMQSGSLHLEEIPFDLAAVLRDAIDMLMPKATERGLALKMSYADGLPRFFQGDPMRIRQIVTNLVGNAIKFTEKGGAVLSVEPGEDSGAVHVTVEDTGIGMTPEQVERIFKPFVQADSSTTRRFGGTGLGVSICKELAELMGGRIHAESQPGRGSCFHVLLHLKPAASDALPPSTDDGPALVASRPWRVLLVEDIWENAALVEIFLANQGHDVITVHNGQEAIQLVREQHFDAILMDVEMPVMDGLEATRRIRLIPEGKALPIIALTASALHEQRHDCFKAGMDAFLAKPLDFGELLRTLAHFIETRETLSPRASPPSPETDDGRSDDPPITEALEPGSVKRASLADLEHALDSDNPEEILPVLEQLAAGLSHAERERLRSLVNDFEFQQARSLVALRRSQG